MLERGQGERRECVTVGASGLWGEGGISGFCL